MTKILFQGDSIINAFRKPEEINPAFQQGNGYVFLIAVRLGRDYPGFGFSFINRGVSSNCVSSLLEPFLLETGRVTAEWREHLAPRPRISSFLRPHENSR